ncbi:hypothetical protein XENTR_v10018847 [Xenopus tropicalis]|nr:hypothetical protein XENTR_v10018847 [Xenopus tropicalis]
MKSSGKEMWYIQRPNTERVPEVFGNAQKILLLEVEEAADKMPLGCCHCTLQEQKANCKPSAQLPEATRVVKACYKCGGDPAALGS